VYRLKTVAKYREVLLTPRSGANCFFTHAKIAPETFFPEGPPSTARRLRKKLPWKRSASNKNFALFRKES